MSMLISAFSTGITQRIVVYSKENIKPTKTERKTKGLHFDISGFSSSSSDNISTMEGEQTDILYLMPNYRL